MKTFAIVVTYNREILLRRCIEAIQQQTYQPHAIIIIDNASTDNTPIYLNDISDNNSNITTITLKKNVGGSGGFHAGIKYASSIDDALPNTDALEKFVDNAINPENIYGSVAIDETDGSTKICWPFSLIDARSGYHKEIQEHWQISSLAEVNCLPFLGFYIHTSLTRKLGLPEKDFFLSGDDMEYCIRARKAGSSIIVVPNSIIRHPLPSRIQIRLFFTNIPLLVLSDWKRYYDTRNRILLAKKHFGPKLWTHTLPGTFLRLCFCLIIQKNRVKQLQAFAKGITDGLLGRSGIRWPPGG
ncbi:glycosyltransferase [Desulfosediminicola flagellatus]|uniref:glycosyltransferase n=1 Tax=Desulfosediminicola flagellatus TaxID=2569541 RepID=UPI0010AD8FD4|nr:glycosyltransferase [Desulfosediminicola flagellatus]